jgi:hypothetical protein
MRKLRIANRQWSDLSRREQLDAIDQLEAEIGIILSTLERGITDELRRAGMPHHYEIEGHVALDPNHDPRLPERRGVFG